MVHERVNYVALVIAVLAAGGSVTASACRSYGWALVAAVVFAAAMAAVFGPMGVKDDPFGVTATCDGKPEENTLRIM